MNEKIERQRRHFDAISGTYRRSRQDENHLALKSLIWSTFLADKAFLKDRHLRVLEPMCGYADGHAILSRHLGSTIDYTGFDYSNRVVAEVQAGHPEWNVFLADVTRFQPEENAFDLVILLGGLHHVPEHAEIVVRRLGSALRPEGCFISLEPTHGNRLFRLIRERIYKRNPFFDEETEQAFTLQGLMEIFEGNGFRLLDRMFPGLFSYVLYYNPDAFPGLNLGGPNMVRAMFAMDRPMRRGKMGGFLSFATLSLWQRID